MFDNKSSKSSAPPGNLPTSTDSSFAQSDVGKAESAVTPQDQPKAAAAPIRHDGQIEDIFANTDQARQQPDSSEFKVSSAGQGSGKGTSFGQSSQGIPSASASLMRDGSPGQSGPTHFLSGSGLKPKTDNDLGSGDSLTPDKIEFSDDKPQRKKYFIIGLIGLLVVGSGALAYWLLVLNKPLELDSLLNANTSTKTPVNTGSPQEPTQATPDNSEPTAVPVAQPIPTTEPTDQIKPEAKSVQPALSDLDQDGLLDSEEAALKTNPRKADTDSDGLFDKEEVKVYLTDPNNPDTDGDGYLDGEEVDNGFNPKGEGKLLPDIN